MFWRACSRASVLDRATSPPLQAEYTASPDEPPLKPDPPELRGEELRAELAALDIADIRDEKLVALKPIGLVPT